MRRRGSSPPFFRDWIAIVVYAGHTMRYLSLVPLVVALAACGGAATPATETPAVSGTSEAPAPVRDAAATTASFKAAAERMASSQSSGTTTLRPLETPLPDGILPDFEYSRVADMTTRVANTMRQVSLQVRGITPNDALLSLEKAFVAKGFASSGAEENRGGNLMASFTKGGEGRALTMVVASGGTHVMVITNQFDEATQQRGGFAGVLQITINTP